VPAIKGFQIADQQIVEDEPKNNDQLWLNSTVYGASVETLAATPGISTLHSRRNSWPVSATTYSFTMTNGATIS